MAKLTFKLLVLHFWRLGLDLGFASKLYEQSHKTGKNVLSDCLGV